MAIRLGRLMATTFAVDLQFAAKTQQLDRVFSRLSSLERELGKLKGTDPFQGVENSARGAGQEIDRTKQKVSGLGSAFGKLAAAYGLMRFGGFAINAAADIEITKKRLETLTGSAEKAENVFSRLQEINKQSPFELKDLTGAAAKLSAFGVQTDQLVTTTERLGKIAAGTGQDIDGIATAYGQVLAKGRLMGEELMQFQERGIGLNQELQRMLGVSGEQLSDMISKGQVGSDLVVRAIENMTGATGQFRDAFSNTSGTIQAKLSNMRDAFYTAAAALVNAFGPALTWLLDQITKVANYFASVFARIDKMRKGESVIADELSASTSAKQAMQRKYGPLWQFNRQANKEFDARKQAELGSIAAGRELKRLQDGNIKPAAAPRIDSYSAGQVASNRALLNGGDGGSSKKKEGGSTKKADDRSQEIASLSRELQFEQKLTDLTGKRLQADLARDQETSIRLQGEERLLEISRQMADAKATINNQSELTNKLAVLEEQGTRARLETQYQLLTLDQERKKTFDEMMLGVTNQTALSKAQTDEQRRSLELEQQLAKLKADNPWITDEQLQKLRQANQELWGAQDAMTQLKFQQDQLNGLLNGMGQQFSGLFDVLISGTNDWQQTLANTLKQFSSLLFSAGLNMLGGNDGKGFFSFLSGTLGKRAAGGPVAGGTPYLVGEKGPELFVPGANGGIVPNDKLGGGAVNSVVNVTINNDGSSKTDSSQGAEMGRMINASVMAIINREKRPGGALNR
jgi:tape measure domain-containing protein